MLQIDPQDPDSYTLNPKDMELISKYTEMPKYPRSLQIPLNTLTKQLEINRLHNDPVSQEKVQNSKIIGFPVSKEKYLNGCMINELNQDLLIRTNNEGNFFGRIKEINDGNDSVSKIVYENKPVELKYNPQIGLKKKFWKKIYPTFEKNLEKIDK